MKGVPSIVSESVIRGSVFGISAFVTVVLVSVAYAAIPWGSLPQAAENSLLTSQSWNELVSHVNQSVKQTTEVLTVNGSNVGIGISSPGQKLSVAGTIESTSGGFKFPDGSVQTTAGTSMPSGTLCGFYVAPGYGSANIYCQGHQVSSSCPAGYTQRVWYVLGAGLNWYASYTCSKN